MILHGGSCPGPCEPGMTGHELIIVENAHDFIGCLQPEGFPAQVERSRVKAVGETHVTVPVQFHPSPLGALGRSVGQGLEQVTFGLGEKGKRPLSGGAVEAVAGLSQYPLPQLVVGIGKGPEVSKRKETPLDILDA